MMLPRDDALVMTYMAFSLNIRGNSYHKAHFLLTTDHNIADHYLLPIWLI